MPVFAKRNACFWHPLACLLTKNMLHHANRKAINKKLKYNTKVMGLANERNWKSKYEELNAYILEHKHLPSKKKQENRNLVNWWKYNRKLVNRGTISQEHLELLRDLAAMRETSLWETGQPGEEL